MLGNLKSLTWHKSEEWKSLTKEIQTLQQEKNKNTTKKPYTSTTTESRTPQSGPWLKIYKTSGFDISQACEA